MSILKFFNHFYEGRAYFHFLTKYLRNEFLEKR